jgi:putative oligomerization/nucleic acid binding protein/phospholipase D-like protein
MVAADYPFLDLMWTMLVFFLWITWFVILFRVFADIFRRHDLSGFGKAGWLIFTIVLPFLGVFVYVIAQSDGMRQRDLEHARAAQARFDERVREAATEGGSAAEIERAKGLLDSGAITQSEFDALKQKALA